MKKSKTHREEIIDKIKFLQLEIETAATGCDDILSVAPSDPADDVRAATDIVVNDLDDLLRKGKELLREISLLQQDEEQKEIISLKGNTVVCPNCQNDKIIFRCLGCCQKAEESFKEWERKND